MSIFKTLSDEHAQFRADPKKCFLLGTILLVLVGLLARQAHARAADASATGINYFVDSGQSIAEEPSWDVALGDLDRDGDLDAVTAMVPDFFRTCPMACG